MREKEWNQLLALVIVVSTCMLGAFITFLWCCCCCICKLSIDAFIIGVICILLSSWFKPAADDCVKIEFGSMSDICVFKMFVIEKLLLFAAPLPPPTTPLPKFMFVLICCWFIIPVVTVADGMFWIWFDISCAKDCWMLEFCSPVTSTLLPVEFLTCGRWLWVPVVLMIRPCAVMHRARHVVTRYERLKCQFWTCFFAKCEKRERKSLFLCFACLMNESNSP